VATMVSFFPAENWAIVVLTNSGTAFPRLLTNKILENIFDASTLTEQKATDTDTVQISSEAQRTPDAPPISLSAYAGSYRNLLYGTLSLCDHTSTSTYCREVISNFSTVDSAHAASAADRELYAAWPRFWSTHVRLTHAQANEFDLSATSLYVEGYGANHTPFEHVIEHLKVHFVVDDGKVSGFGLFGNVVGRSGQSWRLKRGGSIRETAEAWFDKL